MVSNLIEAFDVSHWQHPDKWNWTGLSELNAKLKEEKGTGLLFVARATYGKNTEDKTFVPYAELARKAGLTFGAYHFYRQVHSVEDQVAAWNRQMARIGGLQPGECFPVLDMEDNTANGDGRINKKVWNAACDAIGDGWKAEFGGCVLYYSSYFPDQLGAYLGDESWQWMHEPGYRYWLADYSVPDNAPRTPYQPHDGQGRAIWHLHQNKPRKVKLYSAGLAEVDVNFFNEEQGFDLNELTIPEATPEPPLDPALPPHRAEVEEFNGGVQELALGLEQAAAGARRLTLEK